MIKKIIKVITVTLIVFSISTSSIVAQARSNDRLSNKDTFINALDNADDVMMTAKQITALNKKMTTTNGTNCVDLDKYPKSLSKSQLLKEIEKYKIPTTPRYKGSTLLTQSYYQGLVRNTNKGAVKSNNSMRYGFVTKNSPIKAWPTDDVSYGGRNDTEFDLNTETVFKTWERVIILHESQDKKWYYVQGYNYIGWIKKESVAVCSSSTFKKYENKPFLMVTGSNVLLEDNVRDKRLSQLKLTMGTKLPLVENPPRLIDNVSTDYSYVCAVPVRTSSGNFEEKLVRIPYNYDVNEGYLPYTQDNVITQVFKRLGERYGWSGLWESRDCSSLIADVYQTVGVNLPRNTSNQAAIPTKSVKLTGLNEAARKDKLSGLPAGTILYMKGHEMMYLGEVSGKHYVIHATYRAYVNGEKIINSVAVTDVDLMLSSTTKLVNNLISAHIVK